MKKYVFGLGSAQVIGKLPISLSYLFILSGPLDQFFNYRYLMCIMQVLVTAVVVGLVAHFVSGLPGPASIVIGNGLALSSTAVVLQVLIMNCCCFRFLVY